MARRKKEPYVIRVNPELRYTKLREKIDLSGMTMRRVCELADIETYQLTNLASGKQVDCFLSTAKKICNALNCSLDDIFGD